MCCHTYLISFIQTLGLLDTAVKMWVVCMCVFIPCINPEGTLLNHMQQSIQPKRYHLLFKMGKPASSHIICVSLHLEVPERLKCDANCCFSDGAGYKAPFYVTGHMGIVCQAHLRSCDDVPTRSSVTISIYL